MIKKSELDSSVLIPLSVVLIRLICVFYFSVFVLWSPKLVVAVCQVESTIKNDHRFESYEVEDLITQLLGRGSLLQPKAEETLLSILPTELMENKNQTSSTQRDARIAGDKLWFRGTPSQHAEVVKTLNCFRSNGFVQNTLFLRTVTLPKKWLDSIASQPDNLNDSSEIKTCILGSEAMAKIKKQIELDGQIDKRLRTEHLVFNGQELTVCEADVVMVLRPSGDPDQKTVTVTFERKPKRETSVDGLISVVESEEPGDAGFQLALPNEMTLAIEWGADIKASENSTILLVDCMAEDFANGLAYEMLSVRGPITTDDPKEKIAAPSDDEIIHAVERQYGKSIFSWAGARIEKELVSEKTDPAKFVPLIGFAKEHHRHYRCVVLRPDPNGKLESAEVLHVDHHHFKMSNP